jgi:hypothetical protein
MAKSTEERGWREQYDRMKRWQERLRESGVIDERRRDDFYAFFVTCFHLKDWLQSDPAVPKSIGEKAEQLMNKPSMRLCADIANGVKHLVLTKKVRFDADAHLRLSAPVFQADAFQSDAFQVGKVKIAAIGQTSDALAIVDGCVDYWEKFLRSEGLLHALGETIGPD